MRPRVTVLLSLLVVTRDLLFASSLEIALPATSNGRLQVTTATTDENEGLIAFCAHNLDLAIIDLRLEGAPTLLTAASQALPPIPVIGLTDPDFNPAHCLSFCSALVGFDTPPERFLTVVLAAISGWQIVASDTLDDLLRRAQRRPSCHPRLDEQTIRVWLDVAAGKTTAEIAQNIGASPRTVKRLINDLGNQFNVTNRYQLAALAGRYNLTPPSP